MFHLKLTTYARLVNDPNAALSHGEGHKLLCEDLSGCHTFFEMCERCFLSIAGTTVLDPVPPKVLEDAGMGHVEVEAGEDVPASLAE